MRQVGCSIKCNYGSTVAGATRLIAGASGPTLEGGVYFPNEFSIMAGAFALGQVLNFGNLDYIADCYDELDPLHRATMVGNEPPASSPLPGPLRAYLEVLCNIPDFCATQKYKLFKNFLAMCVAYSR